MDHLPRAYFLMVPELLALRFPRESRADCSACPMEPGPGGNPDRPHWFTVPKGCCTFVPTLRNHVAGRILRRGGPGARRLVRYLREGGKASPLQLGPPGTWVRDFQARADSRFGREAAWRCPFFNGDSGSCSIWEDRAAVCRTWFCRHEQGRRGFNAWMALLKVLQWLEAWFANRCIDAGDAPDESVSAARWQSWFIRCADHVDGMETGQLSRTRDPELGSLVEDLARSIFERDREIPDLLVPSIRDWCVSGERVSLVADSRFDPAEAPRSVFVLFSKLDGERPWREALSEAERDLGVPVGEAVVRELYRHGSLVAAESVAGPGARAATSRDPGEVPREAGSNII
jgi:Fe-S-cluster containining protein